VIRPILFQLVFYVVLHPLERFDHLEDAVLSRTCRRGGIGNHLGGLVIDQVVDAAVIGGAIVLHPRLSF